jgi:hypothetical protein
MLITGIEDLRVDSVKETFLAHSTAARTMKLKLSEEKTKSMQVIKRPVTLSDTKV